MKKINIADLLKDCPSGMELDCTMYDNLYFDSVNADYYGTINCYTLIDEIKTYINFTKYGTFNNHTGAKCVIFPKGKTTWEGFQRPFKDGDVLVHTQNERFVMSIYKSNEIGIIINTHAIFWDREEGLSVGMQICCYTDSTRFATEEEKAKLFQVIKDNGYKWNEETKTLEKFPKFKVGDMIVKRNSITNSLIVSSVSSEYYGLKLSEGVEGIGVLPVSEQDDYELVPTKFDINTLKPFDKVLIRDTDTQEWSASLFSHCDELKFHKYICINGCGYAQCIPYEVNKELLGTTNNPKEYGSE